MVRFQLNFCFTSVYYLRFTQNSNFPIRGGLCLSIVYMVADLVDYLTHKLELKCKINAQFARDSYSNKIACLPETRKKITINSIRIQS